MERWGLRGIYKARPRALGVGLSQLEGRKHWSRVATIAWALLGRWAFIVTRSTARVQKGPNGSSLLLPHFPWLLLSGKGRTVCATLLHLFDMSDLLNSGKAGCEMCPALVDDDHRV